MNIFRKLQTAGRTFIKTTLPALQIASQTFKKTTLIALQTCGETFMKTTLTVLQTTGRTFIKTMRMYRSERTNMIFFSGVFLLTMFQFFIVNNVLRFWLSYAMFAVCGLSLIVDIVRARWRHPFLSILLHIKR